MDLIIQIELFDIGAISDPDIQKTQSAQILSSGAIRSMGRGQGQR